MPPTSTPPADSAVPRSGAITTPTGDLHIPSSTRADGSLRKEIKIRPGYRPPEDVEVYKNRTAEAWKTKKGSGVPGAEGYETSGSPAVVATGKNAKRREARRKAKTGVGESEEGTEQLMNENTEKLRKWREFSKGQSNGAGTTGNPTAGTDAGPEIDAQVEQEKQARNLKKKLRQARELKQKKDNGESLLPEQFQKVIKIQELIRQLDGLGLDGNGIQKEQGVE